MDVGTIEDQYTLSETRLIDGLKKFQNNDIKTADELQELLFDLVVFSSIKITEKTKFEYNDEKLRSYENLVDDLRKREKNNYHTLKKFEKNERIYEELIKNLELEVFERNERIIALKESIQVKNKKLLKYVKEYNDTKLFSEKNLFTLFLILAQFYCLYGLYILGPF